MDSLQDTEAAGTASTCEIVTGAFQQFVVVPNEVIVWSVNLDVGWPSQAICEELFIIFYCNALCLCSFLHGSENNGFGLLPKSLWDIV